jgi:Uma2 family endonuclease
MSEMPWPSWLARPPSVDELITDDGESLESERHRLQMTLLIETLDRHLAGRDDVYVGGNMFLYYSAVQSKQMDFRGPDVFVVLDTERRERKAWVIWEEEGKAPDLIIELTSESTAEIDRGPKKRIYGRLLHVPAYFIYDPFSAELEGNVLPLAAGGYQALAPVRSGRLPAGLLGLELGVWRGTYCSVDAPWLRWHLPDGALLPTGAEAAGAAEQARAKAEQAQAKAEQALADEQRGRREAEDRAEGLARQLAERASRG